MVFESAARFLNRIALRSLLPVVGVCLVIAGKAAEGPQVKLDQGIDTAAFEALDREFLADYATARNDLIARQGPIILANFESLTLRHGTRRETVKTNPPAMLPLKAISHAPWRSSPWFRSPISKPLEPAQSATLRRLIDAMERAGQALARAELTEDQRDQPARSSTAVAPGPSRRGIRTGSHPKLFANSLISSARRFLAIVREAGRLRIDGCHAVVSRWKRELTPEEWSRLRVIISSTQMLRKENLMVQYFARLLGEPGESNRIIYAESINEEPRALHLLGIHLVDTAAAQALFDDPRRMDSDLLGVESREYINTYLNEIRDHDPFAQRDRRYHLPCTMGPLASCLRDPLDNSPCFATLLSHSSHAGEELSWAVGKRSFGKGLSELAVLAAIGQGETYGYLHCRPASTARRA